MAYELHRRAVPPQTSLAGIAFTMRAARAWLMDGAAAHEARISRVQRAAGNLTATGKYADDQLRTVAALRALGPGVWVVVDSGPDSGRRLTLDDFDHYIDHYYAEARA
ncbi:MAG: hypothetical protein KC583_19230 [Myxococcales bacterium]|nr:hypothetical protein [Myxococcales bacterium]